MCNHRGVAERTETSGEELLARRVDLPSITAVVSRFPAPSQTFIRRKLEGLRDRGLRVVVASTNFHDGATETGFPLICTAPWQHPADLRTSRGRREMVRTLSMTAAGGPASATELRRRMLAAPLSMFDTDIVHFEFSGIATTYLDALDELRRRARLAVSCRGAAEQIEPLRDPARADALREVFARMDLIHCVSEDMRRTVLDLGAPEDRILVNRPAVPVAQFAPLRRVERPPGPLRVLSIGRLHWKKGLDDGLRAVARTIRGGTDLQYRIVGEGDQREKLTFLIDQLGLVGRAELLGAKSQTEVIEQLRWCDVVLLPSLSEGISNAVLEAMAAGRAVVTTDCGGMTEIIDDGVNGLVVPVGDELLIAEHLRSLGADPVLADRLGTAAARTADDSLDLSHQVERFVTAYRGLVD